MSVEEEATRLCWFISCDACLFGHEHDTNVEKRSSVRSSEKAVCCLNEFFVCGIFESFLKAAGAMERVVDSENTGDKGSFVSACKQYAVRNAGMIFLVVSIGLYGLKVSIFKALNNSNPSVFNACNILCASNTVALVSSVAFLWRDLSKDQMKTISRQTWSWMFVGAILSTILGPLFSNLGWEQASVATVTVLEKSQSVFIIVAQPLLSRGKSFPSRWDTINALLTAAGIVLTFVTAPLFSGGEIGISIGEMYILLASLCFAGSLLISKSFLTAVPPGILTVFRLTLGTVAYHMINLLQGTDKYAQLWNHELWLNMLYFGVLFVTVPQQCWLQATIMCNKALLSTGLNSQFVVQIVLGMIILQSFPSPRVLVGGAFILASVVSAIIKANSEKDVEESGEKVGIEKSGQQYESLE